MFPGFNKAKFKSSGSIILLALLFALESCWMQSLTGTSPINNLLLIDFACAALLVLLPAALLYFSAAAQFFISLVIYNYVAALSARPQLSALINGFGLFSELGKDVADYINPLALGGLFLCFLAKITLIRRKTPLSRLAKHTVLLVCLTILGINAYQGVSHGRIGRFADMQDLDNEMEAHLKSYGYLLTWALELANGQPFKTQDIFQERTCRDDRIADLPLFPVGERIIIIQTESLDFSVIGLEEDHKPVAPFLTSLAQKSLLLHMDGTKLLGSANSDYELLNGKIASSKALYYFYIPTYPDSLIKLLSDKGYTTSVFHGLRGEYMSLRSIYPRLGFTHLYFKEELEQAGYAAREDMAMKQIPDADLFKFALQKTADKPPFVHFIITITMHGGNPRLSDRFNSPGYINDTAYYDDALAAYIQNLPPGCTVFIYGDHQSYNGPKRNKTVPFLIYQNNRDLSVLQPQIPAQTIFSRCEISHYLKELFTSARP